jgi:hypothetical protein
VHEAEAKDVAEVLEAKLVEDSKGLRRVAGERHDA